MLGVWKLECYRSVKLARAEALFQVFCVKRTGEDLLLRLLLLLCFLFFFPVDVLRACGHPIRQILFYSLCLFL